MRLLLTIFLILLCLVLQAQERLSLAHYIRGLVRDRNGGSVLEDATVLCVPMRGGQPGYTLRSGKEGFVFHVTKGGSYQLIATYLGYYPDSIQVNISDIDTSTQVVNFLLVPSARSLVEVVVKASIPPVIVKSDTIAFNTCSFSTRSYASLEDLLRKLPGISIDKDGRVTMNGKNIDKVLLDGKEFFLSDVRTATRNLPAEMVAQIEAYDTETEQGKLTGIQDATGGKTINIKIKKNKKNGYYGDVYVGSGNESSYASGGTAARMDSRSNMFFNITSNNVSDLFTGWDNNSGLASGGRQTLTNASLNYRSNFGKRTTLALDGLFSGSRITLLQSSNRQTFLGDSSQLESRLSNALNRVTSGHINGRLEFNIDSMNLLNLQSIWSPQWGSSSVIDTIGINIQNGVNEKGGLVRSSQGQSKNSSKFNSYSFLNSLDFRKLFRRKGRTMYLGLSQFSNQQHSNGVLNSVVDIFDSTGHIDQDTYLNLRNAMDLDNVGYSIKASYTEPISNGTVMAFGYQFIDNSSHSNKQGFDYDSVTGQYNHPDTGTTNQFLSRSISQGFNVSFNSIMSKWRYQVGLTFQAAHFFNQNYALKDPVLQHFTNWYPRAGLIWAPAQGKSVRIGYSGNTTAPTIEQLQPMPDLTNPYLVLVGNPRLQQSFQHNLSVEFSSFSVKALQSCQLNLEGGFTEHAIATSSKLLAGGVQQLEFINVEGNYHWSSSFTYGFPLGSKFGNGSVSMHGNFDHQVGVLNGSEESMNSVGVGGGFKLNCHSSDKLFIDMNGTLDYTNNSYSQNPQKSTNLVQNYALDCSYDLPAAFGVSSFYNWQVTGFQASLPAHAVSYWNAACYKTLLHNHSGQIRLSVFNLLNGASNVSLSTGPTYIATSRSNILGRLWLLSFIWHFGKLSGLGK